MERQTRLLSDSEAGATKHTPNGSGAKPRAVCGGQRTRASVVAGRAEGTASGSACARQRWVALCAEAKPRARQGGKSPRAVGGRQRTHSAHQDRRKRAEAPRQAGKERWGAKGSEAPTAPERSLLAPKRAWARSARRRCAQCERWQG